MVKKKTIDVWSVGYTRWIVNRVFVTLSATLSVDRSACLSIGYLCYWFCPTAFAWGRVFEDLILENWNEQRNEHCYGLSVTNSFNNIEQKIWLYTHEGTDKFGTNNDASWMK